jgi:hypothetical protein
MSNKAKSRILKNIVETSADLSDQEVIDFYNNNVKRFIRAHKEPTQAADLRITGTESFKEDFSLLDIVNKEVLSNPNIMLEPGKVLDKKLQMSKKSFEETEKLFQLDDDIDLINREALNKPKIKKVKFKTKNTRYKKGN